MTSITTLPPNKTYPVRSTEATKVELGIGLGTMGILFGVTGVVLGAIAYSNSLNSSNSSAVALADIAIFAPRVFVFRPGFNGSPTQGVFSNWANLYDSLKLISGPRQLFFDSSDAPVEIPASDAPYDMTNVEWLSPISFNLTSPLRTIILIKPGAYFKNLANITGSLLIQYAGNEAPCMIRGGSAANSTSTSLCLRNGAAVICTSSQPFIQVVSSSFTIYMMNMAALINVNSNNVIQSSVATSNQGLVLFVDNGSTVGANTIYGHGNITVIQQSLTASVSQSQPGATGSLVFLDNVSSNNMSYIPAVVANWSGVAPSSVQNALDRLAAHSGPIP